MIFELREYKAVAGMLPTLLSRFENQVLPLWDKHGIKQVGFWTTHIGPSANVALHYMIKWESLAEREEKWGAFVKDPEWVQIRATSEANGPYVAEFSNYILTPTSFSALK